MAECREQVVRGVNRRLGASRQLEHEEGADHPTDQRDQGVNVDAAGLQQRDRNRRQDDAGGAERQTVIPDRAAAPFGCRELADQRYRNDDRHTHAETTQDGGGKHQPRIGVRQRVDEAGHGCHELAGDQQPCRRPP